MGHWLFTNQFFVHVRLKGQLLHIAVATDTDKPFPPLVAAVPKILHDPKNHKDRAVGLHESLACGCERPHVTGAQQSFDGIGSKRSTDHRVVNTFTGRGGHNACRITREYHVTTVVPALERLHRQRRSFATQGHRVFEPRRFTQSSHCIFQ